MATPKILSSEHVFVAGQTGTGKSMLAEIYLAGMDYVIKLDTKGEYYERKRDGKQLWYGLKENVDYEVCFTLDKVMKSEFEKIIYVPTHDEMEQEFYNNLMKFVYERENTILWIDELMEVSQSPQVYPKYLKSLYTRGRSKNCAVWSCTQRPTDIPAIVLANSSHYFIFAMQLPQDRDKISKATGKPEFLTQPKGHDFLYWKIGTDHVYKSRLRFKGGE